MSLQIGMDISLGSSISLVLGGGHDPDLSALYQFDKKLSLQAVDSLGPTLDIVRTTPIASYWDSAGIMQIAIAGEARFDHNPVTLESLGLLVEELRENVIFPSADFGSWGSANARVNADTQNIAVAPDGTMTADRLIDDSGGGSASVQYVQSVTVTGTGVAQTVTIFLEKEQLDWALLNITQMGALSINAYSDLINGVVGASVGADNTSEFIEDVGNGWFKFGLSFISDVDRAGNFRILTADSDGDNNVARDGTSSIIMWGADIQAGAFPLSHIPTVGNKVVRNKDNISTSDLTWLGSSNSKYSKFTTGYIGQDTTVWSLHDGTADERIALEITGGDLHFICVDGGVTQWDISVAVAADTEYEVAVGWAAGDAVMYVNGVQSGTDASSTLPTVTTYNIGSDHDDAEHLNSHFAEDRNYIVRKDNQFLEDLSNGLIPA